MRYTAEEFNAAIERAAKDAENILKERESYNQGGVEKQDYFDSMPNPLPAANQMVWLKAVRLKALVNGKGTPAQIKESCRDGMNYMKFLWALAEGLEK